jgi:CheY-like chemotaxis protein
VELRVFLVEDIQNMRALLEELMASLGGMALVGNSTTEAEARLWLSENLGGWDLVITDLVLAQGSGFGVLAHARQWAPKRRIVVFSGFATAGVRAHCLDLGAEAVFDKAEPEKFLAWLAAQAKG